MAERRYHGEVTGRRREDDESLHSSGMYGYNESGGEREKATRTLRRAK